MKKLFLMLFILLAGFTTTVSAVTDDCCKEEVNYAYWTIGRSWSQGFKALPDVCTNLEEFYTQYHKNQAQWDAAFAWLAKTDLLTIPAGRHKIAGSNLVANVEDGVNAPLEKRGTESHYHHIDLQYVVKGTERFALLDHESSYPNRGWKPDIITYDYDASKAMFFDSTPERFFLFFPCDWHIAKIQTDKEDQNIRVIVIKLDYVK